MLKDMDFGIYARGLTGMYITLSQWTISGKRRSNARH